MWLRGEAGGGQRNSPTIPAPGWIDPLDRRRAGPRNGATSANEKRCGRVTVPCHRMGGYNHDRRTRGGMAGTKRGVGVREEEVRHLGDGHPRDGDKGFAVPDELIRFVAFFFSVLSGVQSAEGRLGINALFLLEGTTRHER